MFAAITMNSHAANRAKFGHCEPSPPKLSIPRMQLLSLRKANIIVYVNGELVPRQSLGVREVGSRRRCRLGGTVAPSTNTVPASSG